MADFSDVPESENVEDRRFHPLWMQSTGPHLGPFYTAPWGESGTPGELGEQLGYGDLQRSILNRPVVVERVPPRGSKVMDPFLLEQMLAQFGGGGGPGLGMQDPALGNLMAQSPEAIIPQLAAQGVMPPPMQGAEVPPMSIAGSPSPTGFMAPPGMSEVPGPIPTPAPPAAVPGAAPPPDPIAGLGSAIGATPHGRVPWNPLTIARGATEAVFGAPPGAPPSLRGATAADADQGYDPSAPPSTPSGPVPLPPPRPSPQASAQPGAAGSPMDIRSQAQKAGTPPKPATQQNQSDMLKALQGIKAPPAPAVQNIRSPEVPRAAQLQGNSAQLIQALAQAMGGGRGVNPLLLGTALGRR